ncbi:3-isopropylmalate dehydratase large subunit, partial [Candidatus Gracilibacteria bacterium]|nr:3-isopropylmalate dehydratase large subunit [Candidatus Gracilibacteria bacterium]
SAAKAGIVPPGRERTEIRDAGDTPVRVQHAAPYLTIQEGAAYARVVEIDLATLGPQISAPHFVDNVVDLGELGRVAIDVVYIGTCTNGRYEDMRAAAEILRGRRVAATTRLVVVPASSESLRLAAEDGTLSTLLTAGAAIGTPGCGACIGRHMGVLGPNETCLFTGNRNFRGRMGSPEAQIYLASPEVAAATALTGYITHPADIVRSHERP